MSIILNTDSYKVSMWKQYPEGTEYVYSYIESRGGVYDETLFLGVQALAQYLSIPITQADIDLADKIWTTHGEPFNREGWQYILDTYNGKLPLRVMAPKEGLVIPTKNVLCAIVNTDPKVPWLTTWVETAALRAIWYPTTVGTISWNIKQLILSYLEKSGTPEAIGFKLHDFGARGVSSDESAGIGGAAHLVNFMGTDTIAAIPYIMRVYGTEDVVGFSIPAAEHSTITSWGRENEAAAYSNMVKQFGGAGKILAVVSDSYDIYKACQMWGTALKDEVIASGATVVIRPDSGDPVEVLPKMLRILSNTFGYEMNAKGYKVLNNVRVIWGDGINRISIESILRRIVDLDGYSADNIAFGMGGALLQHCDRDTQKFAMKCSAIAVRENGKLVSRDVFKDPITDSGKTSKKGVVMLWTTDANEYVTDTTVPKRWADKGWTSAMNTYFENGEVLFKQTFEQVRTNSNL